MAQGDNLKGIREATQFPHNDPTKGGRKKKIYTIVKELGYSKEDTKLCFGELIYYTKDQLQEVINDNTKPIITKIVAKALVESVKDGNMSKIKEILEHSIGKPAQSIDLNTSGETSQKIVHSHDYVMRKTGEGLSNVKENKKE